MTTPRIVVVGSGPAGSHAALALVESGLRPVVIDAAARSGGQIYRRPPLAHKRSYRGVYGMDAQKARRLHDAFDSIREKIDYRPNTRVWAARAGELFLDGPDGRGVLAFDKLILCTGATDRVFPIPGWEALGCYSLGGAQIALKTQALALGDPIGFAGAGPLLWLVAWQHLQAGARIAGVWCSATPYDLVRAFPLLALRPVMALRGAQQILDLWRAGVPLQFGARNITIAEDADGRVAGLSWSRGRKSSETPLQALALGWHLRSETQLSQLLGLPSAFDSVQRQHRPRIDRIGRSPVPDVYLAGDGVDILGADAAQAGGRLAARALLADLGHSPSWRLRLRTLADRLHHLRLRAFAKGLAYAFPPPSADDLKLLPEQTVICRCESVSLNDVLVTAREWNCNDVNRIKALTRAGMGRCQGRYCAATLAAVLATESKQKLSEISEHRAQAPVFPLPLDAQD